MNPERIALENVRDVFVRLSVHDPERAAWLGILALAQRPGDQHVFPHVVEEGEVRRHVRAAYVQVGGIILKDNGE